ncbi:helix-turn-helix domain-containing protein [Blastococcus saxobsidens]|uniref:Helix-turn-helix domain-containing protein n=1 Tax=Blastococcus saxobsidens TaxID=138336 RepID=A0A6L9W7M6_9ACTN|nr:helix-turn-helix domain-containing protein [Blastococcus saxobsidens]NEK87440.1 helix-turn-helix domain-containing protein [Blastococcus saxobsidens]
MSDDSARREPELLTITEAAELLRAPVATLRYWRHLGTGPRSFRLGRRVLYRSDDLHSWIDAQLGNRGAVGSGQWEGPQSARQL